MSESKERRAVRKVLSPGVLRIGADTEIANMMCDAAVTGYYAGGINRARFVEAAGVAWDESSKAIEASVCPGCHCQHHRCACR